MKICPHRCWYTYKFIWISQISNYSTGLKLFYWIKVIHSEDIIKLSIQQNFVRKLEIHDKLNFFQELALLGNGVEHFFWNITHIMTKLTKLDGIVPCFQVTCCIKTQTSGMSHKSISGRWNGIHWAGPFQDPQNLQYFACRTHIVLLLHLSSQCWSFYTSFLR